MSRMADYGKTCEGCRHLGLAEYRLSVDGVETVKRQCLQARNLPIWVKPDECCDKWEGR